MLEQILFEALRLRYGERSERAARALANIVRRCEMTKVTEEMVERGLAAMHVGETEFLDTQREQMRSILEAALTEPKVASSSATAVKASEAKPVPAAAVKLGLKPVGKK